MTTTLDPEEAQAIGPRANLGVIFPEPAIGRRTLDFASTWVKNVQAAALIIEAFEADLTADIEEAGRLGVHVEPLLFEVRDLLRASVLRQENAPEASRRIEFLVSAQKIAPGAENSAGKLLQLVEEGVPCVTSKYFEEALLQFIGFEVWSEVVQRLLTVLLEELSQFRRKRLDRIVQASFIESFSDRCQQIFDAYVRYLDGLSAVDHSERATFKHEALVTEISLVRLQSDVQRINQAVNELRTEVRHLVEEYRATYGTDQIPYTLHAGLQDGIERYVLQPRHVRFVHISTDAEPECKRLESARARLMTEHGFCVDCADALLDEFASR